MDQKEFREFYRTIQDVAEHPVVLRIEEVSASWRYLLL